MFSRLALAILGTATVLPLGAQTPRGTIDGRVLIKGGQIAIGYSVIAATPGGLAQFTSADGRFVFPNAPSGRVVVSAKHIGYAPYDTTIDVTAGDTIHLAIEMSLVAIHLPAIHSVAKSCAHPGGTAAQIGEELAMLFEQLRENADRSVLLSQSYPFQLSVERKISRPEPAIEARFVAFDTIVRSSERAWRYAPGKMLGTREVAGGAFAGKWITVAMPEIADFADDRFLASHCFDYGGTEMVGSDAFVRVDFVPAPSIHDLDVAGSVYLDPATYQLRFTTLTLVNLTRRMQDQIGGQTIRAEFGEVLPGVPMLDRVSSVVAAKNDPKRPPQEPATEVQRTLSVHFLKGRP